VCVSVAAEVSAQTQKHNKPEINKERINIRKKLGHTVAAGAVALP